MEIQSIHNSFSKLFPISLFPYRPAVVLTQAGFLIFLTSFLLVSCDPDRVYEENIEIPKSIWNVNNPMLFEVEIFDTISLHNFYINVRNTGMYRFSNLCLFINTTFPDGTTRRDSIECILADERGRWLGSGLGDIWDNQILFSEGVKFPERGSYKFVFEQAQRYGEKAYIENLPFIMDIGLRIERQ